MLIGSTYALEMAENDRVADLEQRVAALEEQVKMLKQRVSPQGVVDLIAQYGNRLKKGSFLGGTEDRFAKVLAAALKRSGR